MASSAGLHVGVLVGGICVSGRRLGVVSGEWTSLAGRQCTAVIGSVGRKGMRRGSCRAAGLQSMLFRLEKVVVRLGNAAGGNQQERCGNQGMDFHRKNSFVFCPGDNTLATTDIRQFFITFS
ncbi:hypothetical protein [Rhizobium laguerreae]|uniref:Uncharacterized protein n=1 Tax=Rhizobium laguerreae TaxID=1076926 RepID=A0A7Y2R319_9HYPH|nr:hypothetical protein [Rhizobium laguerreae]NNH63451.1 hypothetical protein [Rhizobium laguerreae]